MKVIVPLAADPFNPRPSGIVSFAAGLGQYLSGAGIHVEYLCTGSGGRRENITALPLTKAVHGEASFVRFLREHVRRRTFGSDEVVVANTELYAWAFRGVVALGRVVGVLHGPTYLTLRSRRPLAAALFRLIVEPRAFATALTVLAVDAESEQYVTDRYAGVRVMRIPLPVDFNHFRPVPRAGSRAEWSVTDRRAICFAGRLAPEKNPRLALEVFRIVSERLPETAFLVAGTGPLQPDMHRAAQDLAGRDVRLLGAVPRERLPSLYSASDVLLLTSEIEQSPSVVLESLACGTPVVSTRVGMVEEILRDSVLGEVCPNSATDLAEGVLRLVAETDAERAKYSMVRRSAVGHHSWDRVGPQIVEVLHEALGKRM